MRSISLEGLQELFAERTSHVFAEAATIRHPDMAEPERLVNQLTNIIYDGNTYTGFPFKGRLAPDVEENYPEVQIQIDNVDRLLMDRIRSWTSPPTIDLEVFRVAPDGTVTLEVGANAFRLNGCDYDRATITARLGLEADYLNEPAMRYRFNNTIAPGLF